MSSVLPMGASSKSTSSRRRCFPRIGDVVHLIVESIDLSFKDDEEESRFHLFLENLLVKRMALSSVMIFGLHFSVFAHLIASHRTVEPPVRLTMEDPGFFNLFMVAFSCLLSGILALAAVLLRALGRFGKYALTAMASAQALLLVLSIYTTSPSTVLLLYKGSSHTTGSGLEPWAILLTLNILSAAIFLIPCRFVHCSLLCAVAATAFLIAIGTFPCHFQGSAAVSALLFLGFVVMMAAGSHHREQLLREHFKSKESERSYMVASSQSSPYQGTVSITALNAAMERMASIQSGLVVWLSEDLLVLETQERALGTRTIPPPRVKASFLDFLDEVDRGRFRSALTDATSTRLPQCFRAALKDGRQQVLITLTDNEFRSKRYHVAIQRNWDQEEVSAVLPSEGEKAEAAFGDFKSYLPASLGEFAGARAGIAQPGPRDTATGTLSNGDPGTSSATFGEASMVVQSQYTSSLSWISASNNSLAYSSSAPSCPSYSSSSQGQASELLGSLSLKLERPVRKVFEERSVNTDLVGDAFVCTRCSRPPLKPNTIDREAMFAKIHGARVRRRKSGSRGGSERGGATSTSANSRGGGLHRLRSLEVPPVSVEAEATPKTQRVHTLNDLDLRAFDLDAEDDEC